MQVFFILESVRVFACVHFYSGTRGFVMTMTLETGLGKWQ